MIDIQKQRGMRLYDLLFPHTNPELEIIGEICEKVIARKPSLEGHLAEADNKVTLEAYPQEYPTRMRAILCALIFEHYQSMHMLRPLKRSSSQVGSGYLRKTCECHHNKKGHTIEECIEFENEVRRLLDMENTAKSWGESIIIAYDELQLNITVTEKYILYQFSFTPFKKTMLKVYSKLIRNGVFTPFYKDVDVLYSLWFEVQRSFPYHNAADHSIEKCFAFLHDMAYLISIGKIQVESFSRG